MKKTFIFSLLLAAIAVFVASSCEEDTTSYMPTWKGFSVSPRPAVRGDSVTVTACQDQLGHLIYKAVYTWTVNYHQPNEEGVDSIVTLDFSNTVVYDNEPADPSVKFLLPAEATTHDIQVSFNGRYMYSGQGSTAYDGSNTQTGFSGKLRRMQSSPLEGFSAGNVSIPVQVP